MKKLLLGFTLLASVSAFAEFDLKGFEKDLDVAIERAGMSTDLYFACSAEGKKVTGELIQSIKNKAQKLPVDNADQVAAELESSYKGIFDCETNIQKALKMGFSNSEVQTAIERSEKRKTSGSGKSSFDLEAFERDLEETLQNM